MNAPAVDLDALEELRRLYAQRQSLSHALQAAYHSDVIDGHPGYSDAEVAEIEQHVADAHERLDPLCETLERALLDPWKRWLRAHPGLRVIADPAFGMLPSSDLGVIGALERFPKELVYALTGSDRPVELRVTAAGVELTPRWRAAAALPIHASTAGAPEERCQQRIVTGGQRPFARRRELLD